MLYQLSYSHHAGRTGPVCGPLGRTVPGTQAPDRDLSVPGGQDVAVRRSGSTDDAVTCAARARAVAESGPGAGTMTACR